MKTFLTGATGFIGSAVVRKLLARGREVRCLVEPGADRRNLAGLDVEIVEGNVTDAARVDAAMAGCDVVYHLAAIYKLWLPDPSLMYQVNVEGTENVLWAALRANVRKVVYTSSIAAVGARPDDGPADETVPFNLWGSSNDYVLSKHFAERVALQFAARGLPVTIVNPAFPFGERDVAPTPTGKFIVEALKMKTLVYTAGGFNCVDVEDVAEAHVLAEDRGRVGERYIAGGHNVTWKEFYTLVAEAAGLRPPAARLPIAAMLAGSWLHERYAVKLRRPPPLVTYKSALWAARHVWYDATKARRELGMPLTPVAETV
jgi:dihydroflavonol-4-reductase